MPTYWDSFIEEYGDRLPFLSLQQILKAFYCFLEWRKNRDRESKKELEEIMNGGGK